METGHINNNITNQIAPILTSYNKIGKLTFLQIKFNDNFADLFTNKSLPNTTFQKYVGIGMHRFRDCKVYGESLPELNHVHTSYCISLSCMSL